MQWELRQLPAARLCDLVFPPTKSRRPARGCGQAAKAKASAAFDSLRLKKFNRCRTESAQRAAGVQFLLAQNGDILHARFATSEKYIA